MNILIVISSRFFRSLLEKKLDFLSNKPIFVETLAEASQTMQNNAIDLLCIEGQLPDGSGVGFCGKLRKSSQFSEIPAVLLTADTAPDQKNASSTNGMSEIFSKSEIDRLVDYIKKHSHNKNTSTSLHGKVLLVEDSQQVTNFICSALTSPELEIDSYKTAEAALDAVKSKQYDIALIDVVLEGKMTGLDLVCMLRKSENPQLQRLPIIAMSASEDDDKRIELLRQGANDFLSKPMLPEELLTRARNLLQIKYLLDEIEAQRDRLRRMAMTDQLTGLHNRHYLAETASHNLAEAAQEGAPICMLIVDIDYFKRINDAYGHDVGDIVLVETAHILQQHSGETSIVARTGGEEFVILMLDCDGKYALEIAEDLRERVEASNPEDIPVTISIGLAEVIAQNNNKRHYEEIFKCADEALYEAKESGRNRIVCYQI